MIDERAFQSLVAHAGRETAKRMIARFVELSPEWRRELSEAQNTMRVEKIAHEIVTSAGAVGLMDISREAQKLEKLAASADDSHIRPLAQALASGLERGERALAEKAAAL